MGNPFDPGKGMAEAALISTSVAACVIPVAWTCAGEMYKMQSDPGGMFTAGQAWLRVADRIGEAVTANESLTNSVTGTGWRGKDSDGFTDKAAQLSRELMVSQVFAYTVGIALMTMASALFASIVVMLTIGVALAAWEVAIVAAVASIIGDFGPAEAMLAEANVFAGECASVLGEVSAGLTTLGAVLAGTITALLAGDVAIQSALGDGQALTDLGQASVDGLGTVLTGLVARVYRDLVGAGMGTNPIVRAVGLTEVVTDSTISGWATKQFDPSRN